MRGLMLLTVCLAWLTACKGDDRKPTPGTQGMTPAGGDEIIRPDEGSARGRALAGLLAMKAPALDAARVKEPACAEYARNMRSFLATLEHELGRLRAQGTDGVTPEVLARLGAWLDSRAGSLDQMSKAKALQETGEMARLHRELVAAMRDLADALNAAYGASTAGPDSAEAVRVDNAVANLQATFAALETLCTAG